ncbi:hypothetical protein [Pseudobdellovibrio exovorus]|uniref:Lipoprotein n=1 Tax=Pseudobdellovibrio exovorus JSS TaxID=1184267 RepID=M4V4L7_9BACT|nr:hypothetical protein [Pseudobdellovibrio exovorus]AGH94277.1 hypothetical protein A11Q_57 [Pseudobdellovibrio exovorus JSS]
MKKQILFLMAITALSSLGFSCGIKGPPLPPLQPETIQKQKAQEAAAATPSDATPDSTTKKKTQ